MSRTGLTGPTALRPLTVASTVAVLDQSGHYPTSTRCWQTNERTNGRTNRWTSASRTCGESLTLYRHIKTAQQRTIRQYGDWYCGRWWVGCYIWYSEEETGPAVAQPSLLLAVPNVISTASVPTSYHSMRQYNCLCTLKGELWTKN